MYNVYQISGVPKMENNINIVNIIVAFILFVMFIMLSMAGPSGVDKHGTLDHGLLGGKGPPHIHLCLARVVDTAGKL